MTAADKIAEWEAAAMLIQQQQTLVANNQELEAELKRLTEAMVNGAKEQPKDVVQADPR